MYSQFTRIQLKILFQPILILFLTLIITAKLFPCYAQQEYKVINPTKDGIGKVYMGRHISRFMSHLGANWLERPERLYQERPNILIKVIPIQPDYIIADIGAGSGYFSFKLSKLVPHGKVYAVDIQEKMLEIIKKKVIDKNIRNINTVLGSITNPKLPKASIDIALLVDAYHEFSHPKEMCSNIFQSLKVDGKLILVEYRAEDDNIPIKKLHKMSSHQIIKEISACGFRWQSTDSTSLPWQHIVIFKKP